jgi:potassium efflux system protein
MSMSWRCRAACWWLLLGASMCVRAQSDLPPDQPSQAAIAEIRESIDQRYAAVESDATLDDVTRADALERLDEARELLSQAAADIDATALIARERSAAPELQAALDAELSQASEASRPADLTKRGTADLKIAADEATAAADAALRNATALEEERNALRARRPLIGPELADARAALSELRELETEIRAASVTRPGTGTSLLRTLANEQALLARISLLEEQRAGLALRERLLASRIRLARQSATTEARQAEVLRDEYDRRQRALLLGADGSAISDLVARDPQARAMVDANAALLAEYPPGRAAAELAAARADLAAVEDEFTDIVAETKYTERTLASLGRSYASGQIIVEALRALPGTADHQLAMRERARRIEESQLDVIGLSRERMRLERQLDASMRLSDVQRAASAEPDPDAELLRQLRSGRLELLQRTTRTLEEYIGVLAETQAREQALVASLHEYEASLRSRQVWVPNLEPIRVGNLLGAVHGFGSIGRAELWRGTGAAFVRWVREQPLLVGAAMLAMIALLVGARRIAASVPTLAEHVVEDSLRSRIVRGALPPLLSAVAGASSFWLAGWLLSSAPGVPPGTAALGSSVMRLFHGILLLLAVLLLYAPRGPLVQRRPDLAGSAADVRKGFGRIAWALALLALSRILFEAHVSGIGSQGERAARLCLVLAAFVIAWAGHGALRPDGPVVRTAGRNSRSGKPVWAHGLYVLVLVAPLLLCLGVLGGYVQGTFLATRAVLGTLAVIAIYLALRAILLERVTESVDEPADASERLQLGRNNLLKLALIFVLVLGLAWVWANVPRALGYLNEVTLWTSESELGVKAVTVASLLKFLLLLAGTLLLFWSLPIMAGTKSIDTSRAGIGTRYAAITLLRYGVLIAGVIGAFSLLNIGWSKLQWMAAGLSVGLGFSLQETVSNFIAGLMLLTERQVRVGDLISVGDKTGTVTRILMRATTVRDFDGREVILPNKELVTTQVTNWTLSDTHRRMQIAVGVAYGSDPELVEKLMLEAARAVPWVIGYPAPRVVFEQFGDDALQFRLYVWISSRERVLDTVHDLHNGIDRQFREHGVEIAFPQRDVHLDATTPLPVRVVDPVTETQ